MKCDIVAILLLVAALFLCFGLLHGAYRFYNTKDPVKVKPEWTISAKKILPLVKAGKTVVLSDKFITVKSKYMKPDLVWQTKGDNAVIKPSFRGFTIIQSWNPHGGHTEEALKWVAKKFRKKNMAVVDGEVGWVRRGVWQFGKEYTHMTFYGC